MKTAALSIRIEPALMRALRAEAKKQRRSLAALCHLLLEQGMASGKRRAGSISPSFANEEG